MSSPTTIPYRFNAAVAIAPPTCALIFFSSAHVVIEGRERDYRRMVRASIEAMAYAEASVQSYALTPNPVSLKPYAEALARRQSFEHAWDQTAVRNTFANMERIEKYVDAQSPSKGDPRLTVMLTEGGNRSISSDRKPAGSSAVRIWSSITWAGNVSRITGWIGQ